MGLADRFCVHTCFLCVVMVFFIVMRKKQFSEPLTGEMDSK